MDNLLENEVFCTGIAVGICIYQQKVVMSHERGKPLIIDGKPYFIQDSNELLRQMLDEICR